MKAGDLLFVIDPRPYEAALRQVEANLARDKALANKAQTDAGRYAELIRKQFVSQQDYDQAKATAEYWADGPDSTLPPGHWMSIALQLADARNSSAQDTVYQMLLVSAALYDAGLACWDSKRFYDSARPLTAIQCLLGAANQTAYRWAGPYQGVKLLPLATWVPYQNIFFVTPAFAEYTSGHSSFSYAAATVLRSYWGSDELGYQYTVPAGSSLFEPKLVAGQSGFIAGVTDIPNTGARSIGYSPAADVLLDFPTLTSCAESAGYSRRLGGIHFEHGDLAGRELGANVGQVVFDKMQSLVKDPGSASGAAAAAATVSAATPTVVNINFAGMFTGVTVNGATNIATPTVN